MLISDFNAHLFTVKTRLKTSVIEHHSRDIQEIVNGLCLNRYGMNQETNSRIGMQYRHGLSESK